MKYQEGDVLANKQGKLLRVIDTEDGFARVLYDDGLMTWLNEEMLDMFWRKVEE